MIFRLFPYNAPCTLSLCSQKDSRLQAKQRLTCRAVTFPAYAVVPISIIFYKSDPMKKLI